MRIRFLASLLVLTAAACAYDLLGPDGEAGGGRSDACIIVPDYQWCRDRDRACGSVDVPAQCGTSGAHPASCGTCEAPATCEQVGASANAATFCGCGVASWHSSRFDSHGEVVARAHSLQIDGDT